MTLTDRTDAFGHALYDFFKGERSIVVNERDAGYVDVEGVRNYFTEYDQWPERVHEALQHVVGPALDIGCGAGRHLLYLKQQGIRAVGIDVSPLAVKVCRLRRIPSVKVMSLANVSPALGRFNTILMLGSNFGLLGSPDRGSRLLRQLLQVATESTRIVAEVRNPYIGASPEYRAYHRFNRRRGRLPGQLRLRVRYKDYRTPWFDYLFVSPTELKPVVEQGGWLITKLIRPEEMVYIAVLARTRGKT